MPRALAARWYSDHDQYQNERRAIWGSEWLMFGVTAELSRPGQYVADEIAGYPLLVVVDPQGALRGFHNVCPHRAGVIQWPGCGQTGNLVCRYHGWAFSWDGSLKSARDFGDTPTPDDHSLRSIRVETWGPLVFVNLDENAPSLMSTLGSLDTAVRQHDFAAFSYGRRVVRTLECNWKTYVDNYLEGYHVPHVHPTLNAILDYRSYTTTQSAWHSLQSSPLESAPDAYGSGEVLYYFIYPNTMLNILPGRLQTNRVLPLKGNRCRVEFDFLYREAPLAKDREFSDVVQQEDIRICEDVQRNLESGSYVSGRLNPTRESGVHHFQELLRADYRDAFRRAKELRRQT